MLQQLYIRNYVIIDELVFEPELHLNVVTGETGAGKSIIIGALGLILGERADANTLRDKEKKCIVEARFDVNDNEAFAAIMLQEGLDNEPSCIIRREIAVNGKSRTFVNDTPVTLTLLSKLTSLLVDLHQQFGHLALKEDNFQMQVVDAVANNSELLKGYKSDYTSYKKIEKEIAERKAQQLQAQKEADYKQFLFDELEQAAFSTDEIEHADAQLKLLSSSERVITTLQSVRNILLEGDTPIVNELKRTVQQLQTINDVMNETEVLQQRLNAAYEEIKDVANELESLENKVSIDPQAMVSLQERIDIGYKLLKKHGLQSTNELIELHNQLSGDLQNTQTLSDDIMQLEEEQEKLLSSLVKKAKQLSQNRVDTIPSFEKRLNELLKVVGMPNAKLAIELQPLPNPTEHGLDSINFLLDANKSGNFTPVYKAASGGEMSRIMLSIKSLTAKAMQLPTLIFDEVDTGISGEAAKQVGILLKDLAKYHQVICITHQPQVAAKADTHFYIYKDEKNAESITAKLRELNEEEHVFAIAQMIGGEKPSDVALKNAKELAT